MKKTEKKSLLDEKLDDSKVEKKLAPSNAPKRRSVKKKEDRPVEKPESQAKGRKTKVATPKSASPKSEPTKTAKKASATAKRASAKTKKATPANGAPSREAVLAEIKDRIAKVPLSKTEKARRARRADATSRVATPAEKAYSGRLPAWERGWLVLKGARKNNLQSVDVPFPIGAFTVVTGVSGSGKSSLVEDAFYESLQKLQNRSHVSASACDGIVGWEAIRRVSKVDQSPIGQTPTSNPATYTGVFDYIRTLFAQTQEARAFGFQARRFSFNAPGGRCEKCEGAGQIKIEMQFLADVWVTCDECNGKRYNPATLSVRYRGKTIADVLEMTCGDALEFFSDVPKIKRCVQTLCDVGLEYLPLGQSSTTLSGGEAQRVKLATELSRVEVGDALYVLDEPTTGLHFSDVRKLVDVLQKLVDLGNTVVVVEHNLDVIKCADWIVDVGPDAGSDGGKIVYAGTPEGLLEYVAKRESSEETRRAMLRSYTGESLFRAFERGVFYEREPLDVDAYLESLEKEAQVAEETGTTLIDSADPMWEVDGRRWHLVLQKPRVGERRHWDPRILSVLADKIEDEMENVEINWNDRSIVEARDVRNGAWFMRAVTNDEWLLKLRFRAAKDTFEEGKLAKDLGLKPLSEVKEIPIYGIKPRARVDFIGGRQEIELKVFSYREIDTPAFWKFVETAMKSFGESAEKKPRDDEVDLTPWITQGREWHLSPGGAYGRGKIGSKWTFDELRDILDLFEKINGSDRIVWKNKIVVDFLNPYGVPWARIYTKNAAFIRILLYFPLGWPNWDLVMRTRLESTEEQASDALDSVSMIYDGEERLNRKALKDVAMKARETMLDVKEFGEEF